MPTNIVLIGFMGSGKSSIGRLVAARLGFQFVDTDALLVERDGRAIAEIFAREGKLMLTRGGDYILIDGKFPRLTAPEPTPRLREMLAMLRSL